MEWEWQWNGDLVSYFTTDIKDDYIDNLNLSWIYESMLMEQALIIEAENDISYWFE